MDGPGIDLIRILAVSSAAPVVIREASNDRQVNVSHGGIVTSLDIPAKPRQHAPETLADVIALANRFFDANEGVVPVVWYNKDAVVLVIDDAGHRIERATLKLEFSDRWMKLRAIAKLGRASAWYDQKEFYDLLRIDLAGTGTESLIREIKSLKWSNQSMEVAGRSKASKASEFVVKKEGDEEDLMEQIVLNVPVFKTAGERDKYRVSCTVDADLEKKRLQILPFPDEIEGVEQAAMASIAARLEQSLNDSVRFHAGTP